MANHMSLGEKLSRYEKQILQFETKKKWKWGNYTLSEYVFLLVVGLWLADILPRFVSLDVLWNIAAGLTVLYVLYLIAAFLLSGGRGRVVDLV